LHRKSTYRPHNPEKHLKVARIDRAMETKISGCTNFAGSLKANTAGTAMTLGKSTGITVINIQ